MCGRFTLTQPTAIAESLEISEIPDLSPRYNIAPSQQIVTIIQEKNSEKKQFQWMRWGLIPSWAKDPKIGYRLINARAETLSEKPSFREAFKCRRCLIVADGFYEWQKVGNKKQPYYFQLQDGELFAFAGLWETWHSSDENIVSCTIITTAANSVVESIHDRMPVILSKNVYDQWLDYSINQPETLLPLLSPYDSSAMTVTPVSNVINNPAHDQPSVIVSVDASRQNSQ